jgi:hypothetical protein
MHERPNIVLIVADDLGYGDFACMNRGLSRTPTLDYLVRTSVCLTQHYSASPVCAPARPRRPRSCSTSNPTRRSASISPGASRNAWRG